MRFNSIFAALFIGSCLILLQSVNLGSAQETNKAGLGDRKTEMNNQFELATFGGGCFWCVEAIYLGFNGVEKVESGYSDGHTPNPTYQDVVSGSTGHAEVIQITFDPKIISYQDLLNIFFHSHDPTTLNRQGADVGTQYRSVILYHDARQKEEALKIKGEIEQQKLWSDPIVTDIKEFKTFYLAEDYHQNYYANNKTKPYCSMVIAPKIGKIYKQFKDKLKK